MGIKLKKISFEGFISYVVGEGNFDYLENYLKKVPSSFIFNHFSEFFIGIINGDSKLVDAISSSPKEREKYSEKYPRICSLIMSGLNGNVADVFGKGRYLQ